MHARVLALIALTAVSTCSLAGANKMRVPVDERYISQSWPLPPGPPAPELSSISPHSLSGHSLVPAGATQAGGWVDVQTTLKNTGNIGATSLSFTGTAAAAYRSNN